MKISEAGRGRSLFCYLWKTDTILSTAILVLAGLTVAYCVWTLDRGFEITDEAYYLLLAMQAGTQKVYISAQHWITAWLWQISGTLATFRATGLVVLIATSILLSAGTSAACARAGMLAHNGRARWIISACAMVAALLYASTINLSPSYNLLASAGAYAAAGLVLLASQSINTARKFMLYALAGGAIGVEALSKASAGVSTLAILAIWIYAFERSALYRAGAALAMGIGGVTLIGVALVSNTTPGEAAKAIEQGMQLFRIVQAEPVSSRLIRYVTQFGQNILTTAILFSPPLLAFLVYAKTRRMLFAVLGLSALVVVLAFGGHAIGGWNEGEFFAPPFAIVALLLLAVIVGATAWMQSTGAFILCGGLVLLPYSVAMGTGNTLFTQIVISLAPWGVLIGVLAASHYRTRAVRTIMLWLVLSFVATISLQIITSGFRPYHMLVPLIDQDRAFFTENLGPIKVDADTYKFLEDVQASAKLCSIVPGMPFLGLYNIPGIALVLQAAPVMSPWLNNAAQAEFVMERTPPSDMQGVVVALNFERAVHPPALPRHLKSFPDGYRYCGEATYPFAKQKIQIWRH